jgi:hypothetical protein
MYCDRCGARHDFQRARPGGVARLRGLTRGVRGYVLNEAPTFNDAISDAWARLEEDGVLERDAEVQKTFSFCLDCRGYVCHDCWNAQAGRCLTCVPLPGTEDQVETLLAGRLDLVAGPTSAASTGDAIGEPDVLDATPPEPDAPAAVAPPADAAPWPAAPHVPSLPPEDLVAGPIETVDAVARLSGMGIVTDEAAAEPEAFGEAGGATGPDAPAARATDAPTMAGADLDAPDAVAGPPAATPTAARPGIRRWLRPHRADHAPPPTPTHVPSEEDADVIAAAVAAGIILPPAPSAPAAPPEVAAETAEPEAVLAAAEPEAVAAAEPEAVAAAEPEVIAAAEPAVAEPEAVLAAEPEAALAAEPEAASAAEPETVLAAAEPEAVVLAAAEPEAVLAAEPAVVDFAAEPAVAEPEVIEPEAVAAAEPEVIAAAEPEVIAAAEPAAAELAAEPAVAELEAIPTGSVPPPPARAESTGGAGATAAPGGRQRRGDRRRAAPPPRRIPPPVHCRHCGLQVPAVARFCRRCGGRQTEDATIHA